MSLVVEQAEALETGNRILAALPAGERARLAAHLQVVELQLGATIYHQGTPIQFAYFPVDAVISALQIMEDGATVEVNLAGREGLVGLSLIFGVTRTFNEWVVQIPGTALRISAQQLRDEFNRNGQLQFILLRYAHAVIQQISQSVACNRLHHIEERLCRWLLMTHDRVGRDELPLTHEFVARMLGVRRAGVTEALGVLQRAGMLSIGRGEIVLLDRRGLEEAVCECYHITRAEFDNLYR
jgi:CRP-like cAMP-binding protein